MAQLVKNPPTIQEDLIPRLGRSPREGNGYPLQYSGLENSMDCTVYGVTKSRTQLSDFHWGNTKLQEQKIDHGFQRLDMKETVAYKGPRGIFWGGGIL